MVRKTKRAKLQLTDEQRLKLTRLSQSRKVPLRETQRAKTLHISKETTKYLASRPGRFVYVHTPKHGSWLNLTEMAFSKMAPTFLRHIRVSSKDELKERILIRESERSIHLRLCSAGKNLTLRSLNVTVLMNLTTSNAQLVPLAITI